MSAEVGSSGEQDLLDEDLMRNETTRATGFVGKASEVQWLRKLHDANTYDPSGGGPWGPPGVDEEAVDGRLAAHRERRNSHRASPLIPASKASFYLDDKLFDTDLLADPFEMPPFETAERLLQTYMESTHNSFPFLAKKQFVNRFYQCTSVQSSADPWTQAAFMQPRPVSLGC